MSARCDDCKRFAPTLTDVLLIPATPYQDESTCSLCARCLRLFDYGDDQCSEEVAERDGTAVPCCKPAYDLRIDPAFGDAYAVCRVHYRPPFVGEPSSGHLPSEQATT